MFRKRKTKAEIDQWYKEACRIIRESLMPEEDKEYALQKKLVRYRKLIDEVTEP